VSGAVASFVLVAFTAQERTLPPDAQPLLAQYLDAQDEAALAGCEAWLAQHEPGHEPSVLALKARCLFALGRLDDAAASLRAIAQRSAPEKLLLAQCLAHGKEGAKAATALLDEVGAADPGSLAAKVARVRVDLALERGRDAAAAVALLRGAAPKEFEVQLLAGRVAEIAGRPDEAAALYEPLVKRQADFAHADAHLAREASLRLADVDVRLRRYDEAIAVLADVTTRFPASAPAFAQLAICHGVREHYADAIAAWRKAVALAPKDVEYRWRLGDVLRSQGEVDDAIAQFEFVRASGQLEALAELRLGELLLEKGEVDAARPHVEAVVKLAPESADAAQLEGRLREKTKEFELAKAAYRKAFTKDPLAYDAMYRLARLLARSSDAAERDEGEKLLARHRRIEPLRRELELTRQECNLSPGSAVLATRLAAILNLAGEYEPAKVAAARAEQLDSKSPASAVQMAYVLANLGDHAGARDWFAKAIQRIGGAPANAAVVAKLQSYVATIDRGEPLPLPLGEIARPGQK
jgi:tetratricopeptide (TPR) repeat protein